jgi:hypothetical protein
VIERPCGSNPGTAGVRMERGERLRFAQEYDRHEKALVDETGIEMTVKGVYLVFRYSLRGLIAAVVAKL